MAQGPSSSRTAIQDNNCCNAFSHVKAACVLKHVYGVVDDDQAWTMVNNGIVILGNFLISSLRTTPTSSATQRDQSSPLTLNVVQYSSTVSTVQDTLYQSSTIQFTLTLSRRSTSTLLSAARCPFVIYSISNRRCPAPSLAPLRRSLRPGLPTFSAASCARASLRRASTRSLCVHMSSVAARRPRTCCDLQDPEIPDTGTRQHDRDAVEPARRPTSYQTC